jgi:hypothetical protein
MRQNRAEVLAKELESSVIGRQKRVFLSGTPGEVLLREFRSKELGARVPAQTIGAAVS